jgi:beta-glucosidase
MDNIEINPLDDGIDPNASPLESIGTTTTPGTEFSPPESPLPKKVSLKHERLTAREKLASLSLEEKVRNSRSP